MNDEQLDNDIAELEAKNELTEDERLRLNSLKNLKRQSELHGL